MKSSIVDAETINAAADAEVTRVIGEATAARTLAVGSADAKIIELKVLISVLVADLLVEKRRDESGSRPEVRVNISGPQSESTDRSA